MKVLVVDDDAARRTAFERVLRDLAVDVLCADTPVAALNAKTFRPDATLAVLPRPRRELATGAGPTDWPTALFDGTGNVAFLAREGMQQLVLGSGSAPRIREGRPDAGARKRVASLLREATPDAPLP
jgi:CheY-like chemotaxis protein